MTSEATKETDGSFDSLSIIDSKNEGPTVIGARIQQVRGNMTRDAFAVALGVSKRTLQRYEIEDRYPDSVFLTSLCEKFGVNPTWLLLGEGDMYRQPAGLMGKLLAEGRGTRSLEEMAKLLNTTSEQLQRYEQNLDRPDAEFLKLFLLYAEGDKVRLYGHLDFAAGYQRLIDDFRAGLPAKEDGQSPGAAAFAAAVNAPINQALLEDCINGVEKHLLRYRLMLPTEKKARLIVLLYDHFANRGKTDKDTIASYIGLCT
jgi:transcriptional regulator with XRE-family HTH domain